MPIYEYTCTDCKNDFELLIRGSETPACPQCGSNELGKRWSTFSATSASGSQGVESCSMPSNSGPCCGGSCHGHS